MATRAKSVKKADEPEPQTSNSQDSEESHGAERQTACKSGRLLPFLHKDPTTRFSIAEYWFSATGVASSQDKYLSTVNVLDAKTHEIVSDVTRAPDHENPYEQLKEAIIERTTASEEAQLKQVLSGVYMGDKKPSQLLREMRLLARDNFNSKTLRVIWMQKLPRRVQEVLTPFVHLGDLDELAKHADKMEEITDPGEIAATTALRAPHPMAQPMV